MESFQPLINLVLLLSALSIAAERLTNAIKLRTEQYSFARAQRYRLGRALEDNRERERHISHLAMTVSITLAILVKADFFEILSHLNAPWETLGWVRIGGPEMVITPALESFPRFLYTLVGSTLTGASLGFGSKFWHDVLDIVYRTRGRIRSVP